MRREVFLRGDTRTAYFGDELTDVCFQQWSQLVTLCQAVWDLVAAGVLGTERAARISDALQAPIEYARAAFEAAEAAARAEVSP